MNTKLTPANILTALDNSAIGTRVLKIGPFFDAAEKAVSSFDFEAQRIPGQGFILTPELTPFISAGVGSRTQNPADYVARLHRGRVDLYLKRELAAKVDGAALVAYTRAAYLADPDVQGDAAEKARIESSDATHVLVAVLGFAGPKAPLTPYRFVANLAGGNKEALAWTADEIHTKATEVVSYDLEWCTVAD